MAAPEMNCCIAQIVECLVLPCVRLQEACVCRPDGSRKGAGGGGRDPLLMVQQLRDKPLPANGRCRAEMLQPSAGISQPSDTMFLDWLRTHSAPNDGGS